MLRVKICGMTRLDDALSACELGADAVGFIFYEKSPRSITMKEAAAISRQLPEHVARVGVFVNTPIESIQEHVKAVGLHAIQFHGEYSLSEMAQFEKAQAIAVARVSETFEVAELARFENCATAILLDTHKRGVYGGTGETFDWQTAVAAKAYGRIILAGGLTPENIREAVETVMPYAVDVSSGVEASPGKKDHNKLQQLFQQLKEYRYDNKVNTTCRFPFA